MKYYIIAGEPSGDLHGANLIEGLKKSDSEAAFRFWGGEKMAAAGGGENMVKDYRQTSFFGIVNVVKNLRTIIRQERECKRDILNYAPDVVVLVDYPGFNMRIAKFAHKHGLRVFYYIAPKVWAWREYRVRALRRYVDRLFVIFPFETEYFRNNGIETLFCGNPLVDTIARRSEQLPAPENFRREYGLDERPIVALLAGSRTGEIRDNLPDMVALSRRFPERQFVIAGVSWLDRQLYDKITAGSDVRFVCDRTYELLHAAEAAVVTSGTATLETAMMNIPEMVVYHIPRLYVKLRPLLLKIPFVSLVNINLGRETVREFVSERLDVDAAERELRSIIAGGDKREQMLEDFALLRSMMGQTGVADRVAQSMVGEVKKRVR